MKKKMKMVDVACLPPKQNDDKKKKRNEGEMMKMLLAFQPPVTMTRASPMLQRRIFKKKGNEYEWIEYLGQLDIMNWTAEGIQ